MPLLKHAKKKLKQDKVRTLRNKTVRSVYKRAVKDAKANPTEENIKKAFSIIDKAAKHNIIHENKAARLKSSISKVADKGLEKSATEKASPKKKSSSSKARTSSGRSKTSKKK